MLDVKEEYFCGTFRGHFTLSPRNPGLPGFRIIVRKSGRPDLRGRGLKVDRSGGGDRYPASVPARGVSTSTEYRFMHRPALPWLPEHGRTQVLSVAIVHENKRSKRQAVPSLFRFLVILAILGGIAYGAIYTLANWVEPKPREISVTVPPNKFLKPR